MWIKSIIPTTKTQNFNNKKVFGKNKRSTAGTTLKLKRFCNICGAKQNLETHHIKKTGEHKFNKGIPSSKT